MNSQGVTIIPVEDRNRWEQAHAFGGLPGQSWHYAWALAAEGIRPQLAVVVGADNSRMLVPFFSRTWNGATDVATLLGLSGASLSVPSHEPLALWREFAAAQGWVTGYLHFSNAVDIVDAETRPEEPKHVNEVFLLDLSTRDLMSAVSFNIRQKVRYSTRAGVESTLERNEISDVLPTLYANAASRLNVTKPYRFSAETLRRWVAAPNVLALGARKGDQVVAVSLFATAGQYAEYLVNAATDEGRHCTAWLLMNAAVQLKKAGVKTLNIAGGMNHHDGLYQFKRRFNGQPSNGISVGQIYDPPRYAQLNATLDEAWRTSEWFPPYRAPFDT